MKGRQKLAQFWIYRMLTISLQFWVSDSIMKIRPKYEEMRKSSVILPNAIPMLSSEYFVSKNNF